jgi:hypothetical protein
MILLAIAASPPGFLPLQELEFLPWIITSQASSWSADEYS